MKVNREELLAALAKVKPALATKEVVEHATSFAFLESAVVAYNDEISISHPIKTGLDGAIRAEALFGLLTKCKQEELEIDISMSEDGVSGELRVKGKRMKAGIRLDHEIKLPLDALRGKKKWQRLPENFATAVGFCLFSVSTDLTMPALTCVHITGALVESSDRFRLTRHTMKDGALADDILLPADSAQALLRYKPIKYAVTDGWAHFKNEEGTVFSARVHDTEALAFPDLGRFLDVDGPKVELPEGLAEIVDRAGLFASADFNQDENVEVELSEGGIAVKGSGSMGWLKERTRCSYDGEPKTIVVNPTFLLEILSHLRHVIVGDGVLKFVGDDFEHVICLIDPEGNSTDEEE